MNKVVIVTGSTSGIGRETALHFARLGYHVVCNGRRGELLNVVTNACQAACAVQRKSIGIIGDITKSDVARKLVNTASETFGRIDVLVNNAGITARTPISDPNILASYDKLMCTNLRAVVQMCHLTAPHLEKTKGCIVNVSSVAALKPSEAASIYCVSKAAVNMFTKCLALELGPKGVRVNAVNPGYTQTAFALTNMGMTFEAINAMEEGMRQSYPMRRIALPTDVAKATAFLASDDASFTTGECLLVDGGACCASVKRL